MQINRKTVNVCTVGTVVYKRIVVGLIFKNFAFKLFYLFVFFFFFLKDAHSNLEVNIMYLFIYLFGSLPAPSFHGCRHSFLSFFPPLTWGPFGEGCDTCSVLRVMGLRQDSCCSSLTAVGWGWEGPCLLTKCGQGSQGDGGGVSLTCVYRIDI